MDDNVNYWVTSKLVIQHELGMRKICVIIKEVSSQLKTSLHSTKWTIKEYGARVMKKGPVKRDVTNNKE